jgi:hypothetical protein
VRDCVTLLKFKAAGKPDELFSVSEGFYTVCTKLQHQTLLWIGGNKNQILSIVLATSFLVLTITSVKFMV